mmetsp:Transcript_3877/g.8355  ORF Transcript_3877/g.8355 Transcript_3877/m.8355 type:complete len:81 (-) Transcript_3877:367-609(-)
MFRLPLTWTIQRALAKLNRLIEMLATQIPICNKTNKRKQEYVDPVVSFLGMALAVTVAIVASVTRWKKANNRASSSNNAI